MSVIKRSGIMPDKNKSEYTDEQAQTGLLSGINGRGAILKDWKYKYDIGFENLQFLILK